MPQIRLVPLTGTLRQVYWQLQLYIQHAIMTGSVPRDHATPIEDLGLRLRALLSFTGVRPTGLRLDDFIGESGTGDWTDERMLSTLLVDCADPRAERFAIERTGGVCAASRLTWFGCTCV